MENSVPPWLCEPVPGKTEELLDLAAATAFRLSGESLKQQMQDSEWIGYLLMNRIYFELG